MGSSTSRHHKATSPYSSWGQSFDDLLCGPGKICAEEWTPLPSRTQSLSPSRRRRHSIAVSKSGAEVYTVRRSSYSDGIIDQQPMPVYGEHLRSPYHVPGTSRSHRSRRRSYHPREPSIHTSRRPVTPWNPKTATKKKKKKRKRSMHRVDTYPIDSSRRAASEIVAVHRHRSRSRSKSATAKKKPSRLDGRPPWRDVISARQYQEYLNPSPIAVVPPLNLSTKNRSSPVGSNSTYKSNSKKSSSYKTSSIMGSGSTGSGTGSNGTRVVPPRDKTGAEPPPAFRVKHVEDKKYQRIPTAFPGKKY